MRPALLALAVVALAACGGAPPKSSPSAPSCEQIEIRKPESVPYDPRVEDIALLDVEIRKFAQKAELPDEHSCVPNRPELRELTACNRCNLADHICENAEDICRIAADFVDNSWAQRKCHDAKSTCRRAKAFAFGGCTRARDQIF